VTWRRATSIAVIAAFFAIFQFAAHFRFLDNPYFWDEAGQFVPQAHDLLTGAGLLPRSTMPNSHVPGLPLLLAGLWRFTGVSIPATRLLMLAFSVLFLTASFLLAVELLRGARGAPAFAAAGLLMLHPLVFTQSMMAQLDLPAAAFTTLMLFGFITRRGPLTIAAAFAAVACKETSWAMAATLAFFAWRAGRPLFAALLAGLPALLLANWWAYVYLATGHLFGDAAYAEYNLLYPLHPLRLSFAALRRASYLLLENAHLLGAAVLVWRWRQLGLGPLWRPLAAACAAHLVAVSVTGGAVLERYLLPVFPLLFCAFAAAFSTLPGRWRITAPLTLAAGLLFGLLVNPPWPYPLENNLAFVDFVEAQKSAAGLIESRFSRSRVTTAWPLTDALKKPYLGYVETPLPQVRQVEDFTLERLQSLPWQSGDVLVIYSRRWDPYGWFRRLPFIEENFPGPRELPREAIVDLPSLTPLFGFEQRGFWVEFLVVP
jgi:hypothetical protein